MSKQKRINPAELGLDPRKLPQHVAIIMDGNGRWAREKGKPRIFGHRAGIESVRDVVRAYWLLSEQGTPGLVYNVCSGTGWKLGDLVEKLCELSAKPIRLKVDPSRVRKVDIPRLVGDSSLLRKHTGWENVIPMEQTLADLLEFWRRKAGSNPSKGVN